MATMVRGCRREKRSAGIRREQDRTHSVREICLVGTAPGEPGALWRQGPERMALDGREYRVIAAQSASDGGYLHLSAVDEVVGKTDR